MNRRAWIVGITAGFAPFATILLFVCGAIMAAALSPGSTTATGWPPFLLRESPLVILMPLAWLAGRAGQPIHPLWTGLLSSDRLPRWAVAGPAQPHLRR